MSTVRPSADPFRVEGVTGLLSGEESALPPLKDTLVSLLDGISLSLGVPIALLSRDRDSWRFEAESVPVRSGSEASRLEEDTSRWTTTGGTEAGAQWTGVVAKNLRQRDWLLMVPGTSEDWRNTPGLQNLMDRFEQSLEAAVHLDDERRLRQLHRRLYAFTRRLSGTSNLARTHSTVLRAIARAVSGSTGALAVFSESDQALAITDTLGYPRSIVDHVRIVSGEGIIGRTFESGRATLGYANQEPRRLRYQTDSYLAIPLRIASQSIAVVTVTDRIDGRAFDDLDVTAARLFAAPAALALAKQRVNASLEELTRAATVDAVTGLFNRRYFETRIQAEVQRARRQRQDLALLMVDIDDFKRINDTFGHLEGDRALRDVADLLRRGVRIFDVCARYGGEEFAIVMPGATRQMAVQVAERIRQGMHDRTRMTPLPMTVSVGVGFLGPDETQEDLIASADRALIAAKRAGKNIVKTG